MTLTIWCLLIAGLLPFVAILPVKIASGYDNANPRGFYATLDGFERRALAAHLNSLEAFPLFAAAVFAAQLASARPSLVGALAVAFVALRVGYVLAYWGDRPTLRSALWLCGLGVSVALFASPLLA